MSDLMATNGQTVYSTQHCVSDECDYTMSHTAGWCGKQQSRRCGCAFEGYPDPQNLKYDLRDAVAALVLDREDVRDALMTAIDAIDDENVLQSMLYDLR